MRIKVDKVGEFGLASDPSHFDIPPNAWSLVQNVKFDLGAAKNCNGYEEISTPSETGTYLIGIDSGGSWVILYPSTTAIYSYVSGVETDISRAGGYAGGSEWSGAVLGGVAVLNNYSDCPQYWAGADCIDLPWSGANTWEDYDGAGSYYRARVIRSYRSFLFALGIDDNGTEYPYMVHWSDPADPGTVPATWDYADPTTLSGRFDLADTAGYVVDAVPLRDTLAIYKEDCIWLASYVGGQYQFRFDKLAESQGLGILGVDCAVDIGGRHVVVGDGIVYMHDGNSVQNILKGRAADALFNAIDPDNYEKTFAVHNPEDREVLICYPPLGSDICTRAYVFNYAENTWSWREIPAMNFASMQVVTGNEALRSWPTDASGGGWQTDMTASWDGRGYSPRADTLVGIGPKLMQFSTTPLYDGVAPACLLERTGLRFGDSGQVALITEVYPRAVGGSFYIRVGSQLTSDGMISWGPEQTFNPDTDTKVDVLQCGRYHAVRIRTDDGSQWRLNGYELNVESVGAY